jgi:hypothetical protein
MPHQPKHGYTSDGTAVHAKTSDHLEGSSAYARFNNKLAVGITERVGTMTAAYVFSCISLMALPATLHLISPSTFGFFPNWLVGTSLISLIAWVAAYFLQLVLLPIIMVGQNVQAKASDARAAKTFEDTEKALDLLDLQTEGGLRDARDQIIAALTAMKNAPLEGQ